MVRMLTCYAKCACYSLTADIVAYFDTNVKREIENVQSESNKILNNKIRPLSMGRKCSAFS